MKKILFKNNIANIIIGVIIIGITVASYFLGWFDDFIAVIIGAVVVVISLKRFIEAFKLNTVKNAKLLLILEVILDLGIGGSLIYFQDNIELYVGLAIYLRGITFLLITFISTKKVKFLVYLLNIVLVTFGSYLIFTSTSYADYLEIAIAILLGLIGLVYLFYGTNGYLAYRKENPKEKTPKVKKEKKVKEKKVKEKKKKKEAVTEPDINQDENTPTEEAVTDEVITDEVKEDPKPIEKVTVDYNKLTIPVLKVIAKDKGITGISGITKAELIKKINEN